MSTIAAGTTSTTALVSTGDTTGKLTFQTNGTTTAMTIDTSQNVGIGVTPTVRFQVRTGTDQQLWVRPGTDLGGANGIGIQSVNDAGSASKDLTLYGTAISLLGGNVGIGTSSPAAKFESSQSANDVSGRIGISGSSGQTSDIFQVTALNHASGTGFYLIRTYTSGPTVQFAVRGDGTIYAQNTTVQSLSDIRAKENIRNSEDGLNVLSALRPVRFDFKEGFGNNRKNQLGFIAQEVEAVFPDAVDDAGEVDENGDPYKSMGPSALIPVLVKAIQELKAEVDALKAQLAKV